MGEGSRSILVALTTPTQKYGQQKETRDSNEQEKNPMFPKEVKSNN